VTASDEVEPGATQGLDPEVGPAPRAPAAQGFSFGELPAKSSTMPSSTEHKPLPFVTLALCVLCVVVSAGIWAEGATPSWATLAHWGYLPADRVWDGAWWSLITSCFVHLTFWHLAFNVYWLWVLGALAERTLGRAKFLAFVLVAAFVSSAVQLTASGDTGHGASGVGYALFGLVWASRAVVPRFRALSERTGTLFWIWLVGCFVATRAGWANIGNAAHVGGVIFGLLVSPWLVVRAPRWRLAVIGSILLAASSVIVCLWSPWSSTWLAYKAYKAQVARNYDAAIDGYRRALALDATNLWARENLALAYGAKGAMGDYAATLASIRAIDPAAAEEVEKYANPR